jgi:hypothetical protein
MRVDFFHTAQTQKQQASTCEAFPHFSPLFFYKNGMSKRLSIKNWKVFLLHPLV